MIKYLIFDTETTGLNVVTDKPFLYQYGLVDEKLNLIDTIIVDDNDIKAKETFFKYLKQTPVLVGHNIKFDCHMVVNNGFDINLFKDKIFIDTSVLARLILNADEQIDKTFSLQLKKLATRYIGIDSADEERKLKLELSTLTSDHKQKMKEYFISLNLFPIHYPATKQTKFINDIYVNWNKIYHKYPQLKIPRETFLKNNPAPNYSNCSNIKTYAKTDIVLTHKLFRLWYPQVVPKKQQNVLLRISNATYPLLKMERQGLTVNLNRLIQDRNEVIKELNKTKIIDPRTGLEVKIGQHAKLKELYEYETGYKLNSADKFTREDILDKSPSAKTADYLAKVNRYFTTYITGILNKLCVVDNEYKIYTQYNLAGTVTGRLASDFQQFPRDPLILNNGYEVNIRSWFVVPNNYTYMFYFDYSQMELRLQCEWTHIVNGHPDLNLARAYFPYKCIEQNGEYYLEEDPTVKWKPIDLHALTTKHAFPGVNESDPNWKNFRSLGKRANFACNYGASAPKIQQALKVDFKTAQALVNGYKKAFAGVVDFSKWISRRVYITDNIPNLLLRRYYSRNKHLLLNWLVQGSGADILLQKLYEVQKYIEDKEHWELFITVHDEVGLLCTDIPKEQLNKEVEEIKNIMCHSLSVVDVTSDVEYTITNWASKEDWSNTNEV